MILFQNVLFISFRCCFLELVSYQEYSERENISSCSSLPTFISTRFINIKQKRSCAAESRDFWKKEVVEKVKFHYNYRYPEPIVKAQPEPPPELDFWDD